MERRNLPRLPHPVNWPSPRPSRAITPAMSGRIVALAIVAACCSKPDPKPGTDTLAPPKASFTLFALAEVRGQIGPCGCTSDPLGDISRTTRLVDNARRQFPVLVV